MPGQHEDRQVSVAAAQPPGHFDAVDLGHHEVRDDRVRRLLRVMRQQRVGAVEHLGPESAGSQVGGDELGMYEIVVEDVDFGNHESDISRALR